MDAMGSRLIAVRELSRKKCDGGVCAYLWLMGRILFSKGLIRRLILGDADVAKKLGAALGALPIRFAADVRTAADVTFAVIQFTFHFRNVNGHPSKDDGDAMRSAPRAYRGFVFRFQCSFLSRSIGQYRSLIHG